MIKLLFLIFFSVTLSAQTVYKTPSGAKYHLAGCRMVKNVSASLSLKKAVQSGLAPCKICRPPIAGSTGISTPRKVAGTNSENQCFGRTQKGLRCKRKTKIGNNFCFQHLPK